MNNAVWHCDAVVLGVFAHCVCNTKMQECMLLPVCFSAKKIINSVPFQTMNNNVVYTVKTVVCYAHQKSSTPLV